ncbi:hypothetical protein EMQU_1466 [Enterococcus mundtii QU 25]|nr:hypothetical protein EMQU_1466 [Enterococcus mundtii QU 25]GKS55081.1 hypothetical protein EMLAB_16960 [Enterococcus mundtii]
MITAPYFWKATFQFVSLSKCPWYPRLIGDCTYPCADASFPPIARLAPNKILEHKMVPKIYFFMFPSVIND